MRYVTYRLYFPTPLEGYGLDSLLTGRGTYCLNVFYTGGVHDPILALLADDADLSDVEDYDVTEITQAEALVLAQQINPEATIRDDGTINLPYTPDV